MSEQFAQVMSSELLRAMRLGLLRVARLEDELADAEAARVPYWAPYPPSVQGHRAAAEALRAEASLFAA